MVAYLLPGVISTTTQARMFGLHALAWAEAERRGLALEEALSLMRRCELVVAGATLCHEAHITTVPRAHGADIVAAQLPAGGLPLAELSRPPSELEPSDRYAASEWGFAGTYLASEVELGLLAEGAPPSAGARLDRTRLDSALGDVLRLADRDDVSNSELEGASQACVCNAPACSDGPWLRRVFFEGGVSGWGERDRARQATARLLVELIGAEPARDAESLFRRRLACGAPISGAREELVVRVARSWRGTILRNYSVGAWRGLWAWLVEQLREQPLTVAELAERMALALPDMTVEEFLASLPETEADGELLPVEESLHREMAANPEAALKVLALGARRLQQLDGDVLLALAGQAEEDDLGPRWVDQSLTAAEHRDLRQLGRDWATMLVRRALGVALEKMRRENGGFWIPSRIRERDGVLYWQSAEAAGAVGLRIWTLASVLSGLGMLAWDDSSGYRIAEAGALLG